MDKVVQENAANAEEAASASEEMNAQAEQMKDFVGELASWVSGRNGNGRVFKKGPSSIREGTSMIPAALHQTKGEAPKAHIPSMKRSLEKKVPISKPKEVKPNQVIPMEEADLKDF
jgi:methyl-accepting chemotaxis protein